MASQLVRSLQSHAAVLAAEISEIQSDTERLTALKGKYGAEAFRYGDHQLKALLDQKESQLLQIHAQLRSMETSAGESRALADSLAKLYGADPRPQESPRHQAHGANGLHTSGASWLHRPNPSMSEEKGPSAFRAFQVVTDSPILAHSGAGTGTGASTRVLPVSLR